jgi:tetratricopeptide (TPR) repeat protein
MLETLHEYALGQLKASGELVTLRHRHAEQFLEFAQIAATKLTGAQQKRWLDQLEQEHDNVRAALQWILDHDEKERALDFCAALGEFWINHSHFSEGLRWMDAALAQSRHLDVPVRARVLYHAGTLAFQQSDLVRARALHDQSLALARELQDPYLTALALDGVAILIRKQGDLIQARALYEESLMMLRKLDRMQEIPWSLFRLGQVLLRQGDHVQAQQLGDESLAGLRKAEDHLGVACVLGLLGEVASLRGDYEQAAALLHESLTLARDMGAVLVVALGLVRLAGGDTAKEHPIPMARLFGAAEALLDTLDIRMTSTQRAEWDRNVSALCGHLDTAAYQTAWEEGRAMAFERAVAEALTLSR